MRVIFPRWELQTPAKYDETHRRYVELQGSNGRRWVVGTDEFGADMIHFEAESDRKGYSGNVVTFPTRHGGEVKLVGPWKSSAESLFEDTGYDAREQCSTFVVIAEAFERCRTTAKGLDCAFKNVLHLDSDWVRGRFDRRETIAQEIADRLRVPVARYALSYGGAVYGMVKPKGGA